MNFCVDCTHFHGRIFRESVCTKAQIYDPISGKPIIPLKELALCKIVRKAYPICPDFTQEHIREYF